MYRSTLSLLNGRRIIAASLAAVALSTAACSDEATAPTTARELSGPNKLTVGTTPPPQLATFISVNIVDAWVNNVPEKATVKFRWSQPYDSVFVVDNSAKDLDPKIGVVKIAAPTAKGYQGCVMGSTAHYAADPGGALPDCNSKSWLSFDIALGNVYMRRKPQLTVKMMDEFNHLLPGATIRLFNLITWAQDVADGQAPWDEPSVNDGKITVTLPKAGYYTMNEIKTPTGKFELIDSSTYAKTFNWEDKVVTTLVHRQVAY